MSDGSFSSTCREGLAFTLSQFRPSDATFTPTNANDFTAGPGLDRW